MMRRSRTTGRPLFSPTPPETVDEARRLFETTELTHDEIGARVGLHASSIGRISKAGGWRRPQAAAEQRALVASIRKKADAAIAKARQALDGEGGDEAAERAARTLASLSRTLRELVKIDEEQAKASRPGAARGMREAVRDDAVADPDALRDALAERLERLHRERSS